MEKEYPMTGGEWPWSATEREIRNWTKAANKLGHRVGFGADNVEPGNKYFPGVIAAAQDIALDDLVERYGTSL